MAVTPMKIQQALVGDLQLVIRAKNGGKDRLVNLGSVSIPYEIDVTLAVADIGAGEHITDHEDGRRP